MHKIHIIGRVTRDPELRYLDNGREIVVVGVASNSRRKKGDVYVEETIFFDVAFFGPRALFVSQNFNKGKPIEVWGKLSFGEKGGPRIWTDKDGNPRASFEVIADEVNFLPQQSQDGSAAGAKDPGRAQLAKGEASKASYSDLPPWAEDDDI